MNNRTIADATVLFYPAFIRSLQHPPIAHCTLAGILHALADPTRLAIVRALRSEPDGVNCVDTMKAVQRVIPKATCSQHFQILREAGLVFSERRGVELINHLRRDDLEGRFPGLLASILEAHDRESAVV